MRQDKFEKAMELRKSGATVRMAARAIGLSPGHVAYAFRKAGVLKPKPVCTPVTPSVLQAVANGMQNGHTYTRIAGDLGMTRNRVAGIVHRHLRASIPSQVVAIAEETATATRDDTGRPACDTSQVAADTKAQPTPVQPVVRRDLVAGLTIAIDPVSVVLAGPGICHWPLWAADDDLASKSVCGTACGREVYCPGHRALAYRPAEARRRAA